MPAPVTVKIAFWILLIGIALDLIGGILSLVSGIGLSISGTSVDVNGTALPGTAFTVIGSIAILFVLIELVILWKMKAGKNWARIVITILELLSIGAVFTGASALSLSALVLSVVAVVLLWVPTSNAYFRR